MNQNLNTTLTGKGQTEIKTDYDIKFTFRRIRESGQPIPDNLNRLLKGLKAWHRKTGGLSIKQIELLRSIENQVSTTK